MQWKETNKTLVRFPSLFLFSFCLEVMFDVSTETSFGQPLPEKSIHMKQNVVTDLGRSVISSVSPPGISMKCVFFSKRADVS